MDKPFAFSPDPDIERAFNWVVGFLPAGEWDKRRCAIEDHLETLFEPKANIEAVTQFHRLVGTEDRVGWYLYLVQTSQHEPYRTEVNQAARVLPIFKRIGIDLDLLLAIDGIESQVVKLLQGAKSQPDSVLFEMVVALLWKKNGWSDVSFISPIPTEKRPDIRAATGGDEWFIETKRLTTNSEYSQKERAKWLRMWLKFRPCLIRNTYPFILDLAFHVELDSLDDEFVLRELEGKLRFVTAPCHLISSPTWDVSVRFVDFEKISTHLEGQYVKSPSRQLQELIGGSWDRKKGFTFAMSAKLGRIGGDRGINQYVEDIEFAAGAYWHCDAERAIETKARAIRGHLSEAVNQLPSNGRGVVHVGLETFDGEDVEAERYERIVEGVASFDAKGKDLRWVYTHLYESYAPPHTSWFFDETIYTFDRNASADPEPIKSHNTISGDEEITSGVHWQRSAP